MLDSKQVTGQRHRDGFPLLTVLADSDHSRNYSLAPRAVSLVL